MGAERREVTALRGPALTFTAGPFIVGVEGAMRHESDALILIEHGVITAFGPYDTTKSALPPVQYS